MTISVRVKINQQINKQEDRDWFTGQFYHGDKASSLLYFVINVYVHHKLLYGNITIVLFQY